jgi:hypothetical protein
MSMGYDAYGSLLYKVKMEIILSEFYSEDT